MKFEVTSSSSNFKLRTSNSAISSVYGFLLVEATLTIVVIAVGLVFISRGIGGSLKALSTIQHYDRMLRLAETTLHEREAEAQQIPSPSMVQGTFAPPDETYRWTLLAVPVQVTSGNFTGAVHSVTMTIQRTDASAPLVTLSSLWPSDWITP